MTKPKPSIYKAKTGRKTRRERAWQDKRLKMLAEADDLTPRQISWYAGCGYDYALKKFREFGINLNHEENMINIPIHDPYYYPIGSKRNTKLVLKIMRKHGIL